MSAPRAKSGGRMTSFYRAASDALCASFALVGALFLLAPDAVLAFFDRLSAALGMATFGGAADPFFPALAVAYMAVVTTLAWSMARHPRDDASPRLLVLAKGASSLVSFALFLLRQPHLVLLLNGVVDGGIALLVLALRRALRAEQTT
ncbi:MAG TPA: hypothetical protein VF832_08975 [Longimicrobiales bacterium]